MKNNELVTKWVLDTVKEKYTDDIALVVSHTTLRLDDSEKTVSYFVPITEKGYAFGKTFLLQGEGFDLWGIDWNRLEKFSELDEYNITVLADGEILYARSKEDKERFEALQRKQADNLADNKKMRVCALTAYKQAKNIYFEMLFAKDESDIKLAAGYTMDYLAQAIAFSNNRYFKRSQADQMNELKEMTKVPKGFIALYGQVIYEKESTKQKELCFQMINMVKEFLDNCKLAEEGQEGAKEHNYQDLADWYAELSYTWMRIREYAKVGDVTKVYMWGIMLQEELNCVCRDFGIQKFALMSTFDAENLSGFIANADAIEGKVRELITNGGGVIREYDCFEDFVNEV